MPFATARLILTHCTYVADNPLSPNVLPWLMFCISCTLDQMEVLVMIMVGLQRTEELNSKLLQQVQQLKSVAVELLGNPV